MRIAACYSHLNGLEFLQVHQPGIWKEIQAVVESVDATKCRTKVSKEKGMIGNMLYSPKDMNKAMREGFNARSWQESRVSYWVTEDAKLIRKTMLMDAKQQRAEIEAAGRRAIASYNRRISSRTASPSKFSSGSTPSLHSICSSSIWRSTCVM